MLTVTLEFRTEDLVPLGILPKGLFPKYESVELLETLRLERGWRLQLLRIRRRGPLRSDAALERESRQIRRQYGLQHFEVVERDPRRREYVLLVRQRNPETLERLLALAGGRIQPTAPFRIDEERVVASFHGEARVLARVLARLTREQLDYRVLRSTHRSHPDDSAERDLTAPQRAVIARAWALGYYAVPRRITLTRLARLTGRSPPALGKMLRRAEGTLIARFLASEVIAEPAEPRSPFAPSDGER
ncbi:MAG: helix-turn-helix domain-containing protein [Thermoplasmata archaeon]